jgi:hypothetical protein
MKVHQPGVRFAYSFLAVLMLNVAAMAEPLIVTSSLPPSTPMPFACVSEGGFFLRFTVQWTPKDAIHAGDVARFTFRDLFQNTTVACQRPVTQACDGTATLDVVSSEVKLAPSAYHVRVDLLRDGAVLNPEGSGTCEFYMAKAGESANLVLGSFFLARAAYAWDEQRKLYYRNIPRLPASFDGFDPQQRPAYEKAIKADLERHPELQHDGGVAFLYGAEVFHRIGLPDRAAFCEQVLRRTLDNVLNLMMTPDGQLHGMVLKDGQLSATYHIRQQDGFVLKLISQAVLYYRNAAKQTDFADSLLTRARPMVAYQFSQPNPLGCGGSGCKVYDGRILAGLAYYSLTEKAVQRKLDESHVGTVLDFARRAAEHLVAKNGWYDDGCFNEGKCHIGFGNQNILCGLLPARRIALAVGQAESAAAIEKGIHAALDFLARTNGQITGDIQWTPVRHSQWANGNMHEILDDLADQFGRSEPLKWYVANLWQPRYDFWVEAFHRCDILASALLECDEYKRAPAEAK